MAASEQMPRDAVKTIIGDREADIFELFSRIPTDNVHLLIRSVHEKELPGWMIQTVLSI